MLVSTAVKSAERPELTNKSGLANQKAGAGWLLVLEPDD